MENISDSHLNAPKRDSPVDRPASRVETPSRRAKSSLRLKYEAESHVIERKLGSLEVIRETLGLSQRKMAQLLLVDPSAWTRWTKGEDQAPPHIYRMLQWYLALEEKYPALDVNFWLNTVSQVAGKLDVSSVKVYEERLRALELLHSQRHAEDSRRQSEQSDRERSLRKQMIGTAAVMTLVGVVVGFALAIAFR